MVREYGVSRRGGRAENERMSFASSWEVSIQHDWKLHTWPWLEHLCSAGGVVHCITKGSYFEFHASLVYAQGAKSTCQLPSKVYSHPQMRQSARSKAKQTSEAFN